MYNKVRSPALLAALSLVLSACAGGRAAPPPAPAPEPELLGSAPVVDQPVAAPQRDILGAVSYDLPVEANSWVEAELDFLVQQRSAVIRRWLERGDHYEPFVKEVLRTAGVPTDLYHLAMIESGFVPTARSRVGAMGLWQFMPATARGYNLRVDSLVDERMDPVRSTRAAARHLRSLHRSLGDWALAAAAYNAGGGRIRRGLKAFNASNFWDLAQRGDLAEETRHYVPRLYAMTVIGRDRARWGFAERAGGDSFAFDSIQVEFATPLEVIAGLGDASVESLRRLNPHLLRGVTPDGGYWVWVPRGSGVALQRAWLASEFRREQGYGSYTVRWGDSLGRLAELSGVRAARIRELNPDIDFDRLQTGARLKLPFRAAQQLTARPVAEQRKTAAAEPAPAAEQRGAERTGERAAAPEAGDTGGAAVHEVAQGETLWGIAQRYDVAVEEIQRLNDIEGANIRPGQSLRIPGGAAAKPAVVEHVVQEGESLWGIARRYGTSVEAIQGANQLGERPIRPGQKLSVPASR